MKNVEINFFQTTLAVYQRHRGLKLTDTNPSSGLVLFFFILAWKANHQREMVNENFSQSYFLWHCQGGIQILIHSFKSVFMKLINFLISLRMSNFFFLFRVIFWFHWFFFFTKQPSQLGQLEITLSKYRKCQLKISKTY